jgi:hypothetical protein
MLMALIVFALGSFQTGPPILGETATGAIEGTVDKPYEVAGAIVVKTADGISHLFHLTKRTAVHGVAATDEAFSGLAKGRRVVVHYTVDGAEKTAVEVDSLGTDGLREMRGVVTRVDRRTKRLSVRLEDGSQETLELSDRAAQDAGKDVADAATVVVYYTDEGGRKVAHYFREVSKL